jgi:hypothetical protein
MFNISVVKIQASKIIYMVDIKGRHPYTVYTGRAFLLTFGGNCKDVLMQK